jgi:DNA-binding CsgD family transcriptional regulator/tetratricopeptide (TPR) repeat protein
MSADRALAPSMIGRHAQLQECEARLRLARDGVCQVVLIAGEAGIGKSRLVREFAARAGVAGEVLVLQGRCHEEDGVVPYAPFVDALRELMRAQGQGSVAASAGPWVADLSRLLPELTPLAPVPAEADDPGMRKRRLFEAICAVYHPPDARTTHLIILEDLHWLDRTSQELILYLARALARERVLLLGTYRADEVRADHPLAQFLIEVNRERQAHEIRLTPLSRDELAEMLETILGRHLPGGFVAALHDRTGGNPFFTEEVLKVLIESDGLERLIEATRRGRRDDPLALPRSVRDSILGRMVGLDQPSATVVRYAAAIGRRFAFALLLALVGGDERALLLRLRALIAAQLIVEESAETFAFRHALTQQAIYSDLLARERRLLHGEIVTAIEQIATDTEAYLDDLSYHAHEAGAWERALRYARRAGERARDLYAPQAAVEQFTRAIGAAGELTLPPSADLADLYRERGRACEALGDFDGARADHEAALQLAEAAGERRSAWRATLDLGMLWAGRDYAEAGVWYERALALARTLDEPPLLAHSLNRVGNWHLNRERPLEAERLHREALAIFRQGEDRAGTAETLDLLGMAYLLRGDLFLQTAYHQEALVLFRALDDRPGLASCLAILTARSGTYHIDLAIPAVPRLADAQHEALEGLQIARDIGWRASEVFALLVLSTSLGPQGEYARALDLARRGHAIAEEIEHRQWSTLSHLALGALSLDLLALPDARTHLERARALAQEGDSPQWLGCAVGLLARALIHQGDLPAADDLLASLALPDAPIQTIAQRHVWYARAELALAAADPTNALRLAERLLDSAPNLGHGTGGRGTVPQLARLRGEALAACGRFDEAEQSLRAALAAARAYGMRPLLWRIHAALGRFHDTQRRREEADREFAAARAIIAELAADVPDPTLRETFARAATASLPARRQPTPLRAAKQAFGGLTARERDVAALIAQGHSNRTIADHLSLSERTVATHVGSILAKLDLTSRAQIAVWSRDKGLIPLL